MDKAAAAGHFHHENVEFFNLCLIDHRPEFFDINLFALVQFRAGDSETAALKVFLVEISNRKRYTVGGQDDISIPEEGSVRVDEMHLHRPLAEFRRDGVRQLADSIPSELRQWPVQMHLINPNAPFFRNADVVLAADCVAFSVGNFHQKYLKGRSLAIACPKLDQGKEVYVEKLRAMIDEAQIKELNVLVMEVPCCSGLVHIANLAREAASRKIQIKKTVIGIKGDVLQESYI